MAATASTALSAGDLIADRYEIEERLGEGGMAVVYRARHTGTDKQCALKFLLPQLSKADQHREQFLREARVAGRIGSHPHIVDVFDTGTDQQRNLPFIAMELLRGQTLADFSAAAGPLPWETARDLLEQLADALDAAHEAGVVHRDLKPTNVFVALDRRRRPSLKVLDFGIAKVLEGTLGDRTATQVGTPWYSAPEQLGSSVRKLAAERDITIALGVLPATDVWALGLIAYELLCGVQPKEYWGSQTLADQMIKIALDQRARPSERAGGRAKHLPSGFDAWFLRCTRHDAAERYATAGKAVDMLGSLLSGEVLQVAEAAPQANAVGAPAELAPLSAAELTTPMPPLDADQSQPPAVAPGDLAEPVLPQDRAESPAVAAPPDAAALGLAAPASPGVASPALQSDTASAWQELAAERPGRPKAIWLVAAAVLVFVAVGASAFMLSTGPADEPLAPAQSEVDHGLADEPLPDGLPGEPTTAPLAGEGDEGDPRSDGGVATVDATAAPSDAAAVATTRPAGTREAARPTSPAPHRPPPKSKSFDDLFGKR